MFLKVEASYPYSPVACSDLYHLNKRAPCIEFASGLQWNFAKTRVQLGYGVNNSRARVVDIDPADIHFVHSSGNYIAGIIAPPVAALFSSSTTTPMVATNTSA